MDSLQDLLKVYNPGAPNEITALKQYIAQEFGAPSSVGLLGDALVITVSSAALANTLRLRLPALQEAANTKRRLVFRIG